MDWIPKFLYKYFSHDGLQRFLGNSKVRFTQPSRFNDPFEFLPAFHRNSLKKIVRRYLESERETTFAGLSDIEFKESVQRAISSQEVLDEVGRELYDDYINEWDEIIGVFCLTSDPYNILMWSHYADEFKGAIIGFNTDDTFFKGKNDYNLTKVGYRKKRPVVVIDNGKYLRQNDLKKTADILGIKSSEWAYEKEYRMLHLLKDLVPESNNPDLYLVEVPKTAISSIILGPKMKESAKASIRSMCANKLSHMEIYEGFLDPMGYKINIG